MTSNTAGTFTATGQGAVPVPLRELESTLGQLVPVLGRLRDYSVAQRQAVVDCDLNAVLRLTAEQEEASARVAAIEQRRQVLQHSLERTLGVCGLREIGTAGSAGPDRDRYMTLLYEVHRGVLELKEETGRTAALLTSAADVAQRTRTHLERLAGVKATYARPTPRQVRVPDGAELEARSSEVAL